MKTSLFSFPGKNRTYYDVIDYVKANAFDAIELFGACEFAVPDVDKAKGIRAYAEENNVAVSCLSIGANLIRENRKEEVERLKKYVDVAKAAGSPYLHHTLGSVMQHSGMDLSYRAVLNRLEETLIPLCDYAGTQGITILNENQGFLANGVAFFEALIGRMDHAAYGLVADLGNIFFVDEVAEAFVGRFTPFIKHVHVKDYFIKSGSGLYPGEEWRKTRGGNYLNDALIGYGAVAFDKVFGQLKSAGYTGYYSMECGKNEETQENLAIGLRNMKRYYDLARA